MVLHLLLPYCVLIQLSSNRWEGVAGVVMVLPIFKIALHGYATYSRLTTLPVLLIDKNIFIHTKTNNTTRKKTYTSYTRMSWQYIHHIFCSIISHTQNDHKPNFYFRITSEGASFIFEWFVYACVILQKIHEWLIVSYLSVRVIEISISTIRILVIRNIFCHSMRKILFSALFGCPLLILFLQHYHKFFSAWMTINSIRRVVINSCNFHNNIWTF